MYPHHWIGSLALFLFLAPSVLHAGVISSCTFLGTIPNILSVCTFGTLIPGNDPVPSPSVSPNSGLIGETFVEKTLPIDKGFFPFPTPPGITEYVVSHTVTNSTDVPWSDLHIILGTGSGASFASPSGVADFDVPDGPFPFAADFFSVATLVSAEELMFSGGTLPVGSTVALFYALDVDDLGFTMRTFPTFVIRAVSEPPMHALWLLAMLTAALLRSREADACFS
jgi:hypothetical protein